MRAVALVAACVLLAFSAPALATCGDADTDAAGVASVESSVPATCNCCSFHRGAPYLRCVRGVVMTAIDEGLLSRSCRSAVMTEAKATCLSATSGGTATCTSCGSDADCAAGFFCQCPVATCDTAGGTCTQKPQVCPDVYAPVCGCDGKTYPNDCWREAAGTCSSRPGDCSTTPGCFDTIEGLCTGAACSPGVPCPEPNQLCTPSCASSVTTTTTTLPQPPPTCATNADCDDSNGCTVDICNGGVCEHGCICVSAGTTTCCAGPAALCVSCIPFFQEGCTQTSDCCEPCDLLHKAPCAVCISGQCVGAP
ncbi:MAG TPA: hypothetical protein VGK20_17765 [Candidatus Binatia bacterium]